MNAQLDPEAMPLKASHTSTEEAPPAATRSKRAIALQLLMRLPPLCAPVAFLIVKPPGLSDQQQHVYRSLAFLALLSNLISVLAGTCVYLNHIRTTPPHTPALQWSDLGPWTRRGLGTSMAAATASTLAVCFYLLRDSPVVLAALGVYLVGFFGVCWWLKKRQSRAEQAAALQEAQKDPLLS